MISSLRGRVLARRGDTIVVDVNGVGFAVAVPAGLAQTATLGSEVFLHTELIVREDAFSLFGFDTEAELDVFHVLLGVSGVGPKSALGVLNHLTVSQIAAAVASDDDAAFRRVSGIGPKTAKLITVQLQGKLDAIATDQHASPSTIDHSVQTQLVETLVSLGWNERIARDTATHVLEHADAENASLPALLKQALSTLSSGVRA